MKSVWMWVGVGLAGLALGCASEGNPTNCTRDPRCDPNAEPDAGPADHCLGRAPDFFMEVAEDSSLSGEQSVMCRQGGSPVEHVYPCMVPGTGDTEYQNRYFVRVALADVLQVSLRQTDGYVGRDIIVEIRPDEALGRVCLRGVTDVIEAPCRPHEYRTETCAESGTLSVTRLPEASETSVADIHVAGEVRFADGLELTFSVPLADAE